MIEIVVATRSADKLAEIQAALPMIPGLRLIDLDEGGIPPSGAEEAIEIYDTFEENALAKARYFHARGLDHVLADDSGLCVDALGGAPGVRSKRLSARSDLSGVDLDLENNAQLLRLLEDVPEPRVAHYICAIALVTPDEEEQVFVGRVDGQILRAGRGIEGFGYDPLFFVPDLGRTFGEVDRESKNRISHRSRAVVQTLPVLRSLVARRRAETR